MCRWVLIRPSNTDTLLVNNVIYGNGRHGIFFTNGEGGPHYVIGNTIHSNGRSGIYIDGNQEVVLVNNALTGNGTDPKTRATEGYGIKRIALSTNPQPGQAQLLHNLICGNAGGETPRPSSRCN